MQIVQKRHLFLILLFLGVGNSVQGAYRGISKGFGVRPARPILGQSIRAKQLKFTIPQFSELFNRIPQNQQSQKIVVPGYNAPVFLSQVAADASIKLNQMDPETLMVVLDGFESKMIEYKDDPQQFLLWVQTKLAWWNSLPEEEQARLKTELAEREAATEAIAESAEVVSEQFTTPESGARQSQLTRMQQWSFGGNKPLVTKPVGLVRAPIIPTTATPKQEFMPQLGSRVEEIRIKALQQQQPASQIVPEAISKKEEETAEAAALGVEPIPLWISVRIDDPQLKKRISGVARRMTKNLTDSMVGKQSGRMEKADIDAFKRMLSSVENQGYHLVLADASIMPSSMPKSENVKVWKLTDQIVLMGIRKSSAEKLEYAQPGALTFMEPRGTLISGEPIPTVVTVLVGSQFPLTTGVYTLQGLPGISFSVRRTDADTLNRFSTALATIIEPAKIESQKLALEAPQKPAVVEQEPEVSVVSPEPVQGIVMPMPKNLPPLPGRKPVLALPAPPPQIPVPVVPEFSASTESTVLVPKPVVTAEAGEGVSQASTVLPAPKQIPALPAPQKRPAIAGPEKLPALPAPTPERLRINEVEQQLARTNARLTELQTQLDAAKELVEITDTKNISLQESIIKLTNERDELRKEVERITAEQREQSGAQRSQAEAEVAATKKAAEDAIAAEKEKAQELINKQRAEADQAMNQLRSEADQSARRVEAEAEKVRAEIASIRSEVEQARAAQSAVQQRADSAEKKAVDLQSQLTAVQSELEKSSGENKANAAEVERLQAALRQAQNETEVARAEIGATKKQYETRLIELQNQIELIRKSIEEEGVTRSAKDAAYEDLLEVQRNLVRDLEATVVDLRQEQASANEIRLAEDERLRKAHEAQQAEANRLRQDFESRARESGETNAQLRGELAQVKKTMQGQVDQLQQEKEKLVQQLADAQARDALRDSERDAQTREQAAQLQALRDQQARDLELLKQQQEVDLRKAAEAIRQKEEALQSDYQAKLKEAVETARARQKEQDQQEVEKQKEDAIRAAQLAEIQKAQELKKLNEANEQLQNRIQEDQQELQRLRGELIAAQTKPGVASKEVQATPQTVETAVQVKPVTGETATETVPKQAVESGVGTQTTQTTTTGMQTEPISVPPTTAQTGISTEPEATPAPSAPKASVQESGSQTTALTVVPQQPEITYSRWQQFTNWFKEKFMSPPKEPKPEKKK